MKDPLLLVTNCKHVITNILGEIIDSVISDENSRVELDKFQRRINFREPRNRGDRKMGMKRWGNSFSSSLLIRYSSGNDVERKSSDSRVQFSRVAIS